MGFIILCRRPGCGSLEGLELGNSHGTMAWDRFVPLLIRRSHDDPETEVPPMIVGRATKADGGSALLAALAPRAAAAHVESPVSFILVGVHTPFPDVAVHVIETKGIRLVGTYLARPLQPRPLACSTEWHRPAKIGLLGRKSIAE